MRSLTRNAYAKINLGLDVTGRREDGYHLVDMIMQTVGIYDTLTFRCDEEAGAEAGLPLPPVRLVIEGSELSSGEDNLIVRAARCMQRAYGISGSLDIQLVKRIPAAAGMAGGSTDAAATFLALRDLFVPGVTDAELQRLALPLGADIPFCITGGTQRARGIGERLTGLPPAPDCALVVARPLIDVSTAWVYRALDESAVTAHPDIEAQAAAIEAGNLRRMAALAGNVLEAVTAPRYEVIGRLEEFLEERGALRALMTGSGPTVYALFEDPEEAAAALQVLRQHPAFGSAVSFLTSFVPGRDMEAE